MTGMTFSIGIRPLGGVPALVVAVAVAFVAVTEPVAVTDSAEAAVAVVAVRGVRVAGAAAFERAGRVAGVFAGVARRLFVLITDERIGRRGAPRDPG
jgi:hypothetical protein